MYILTDIYKKPKKTIVISESQQRELLTESQESKSISEAIKFAMTKGFSKDDAVDLVRNKIRHDFDSLRNGTTAKFILGVTRMFLEGQFDSADKILSFNKVLPYIAKEGVIDKYTRNLDKIETDEKGKQKLIPQSAQQIMEAFEDEVRKDEEAEQNKLSSKDYSSNGSDYEIVLIKSFKQAEEYSDYTTWCITSSESRYKENTGSDGTFYFCLKHGYEDIPEDVGPNCPLDEYGLSMLAVCVNGDGSLKSCTCRWNHDHDGNDHIMTASQICEVVGVNFKDTFVPADVERGQSIGQYLEMVYDDSETVYSYDEKYVVLSQDRDPYVTDGDYQFDDSGNADYYLYDEEYGETISSNIFKKDSIVEKGEYYTILKDKDGLFTFVAILSKEDNYPSAIDDLSKYKVFPQNNFVVLERDNGGLYFYHQNNLIELPSDDPENMHTLNLIETSDGLLVQIYDNNDYSYLYRADGKLICRYELPVDGDWFTVSKNSTIECRSGHIYDLNANRLDDTDSWEMFDQLSEAAVIVQNKEGLFNLLDKQSHEILSKDWFEEIKDIQIPSLPSVRLNGKYNLFSVVKRNVVGEWGDNAGYVSPKCGVGGIGYKVNGKTIVAVFNSKGDMIISPQEQIIFMSRLDDKTLYVSKSINNDYEIYDFSTGECISDKFNFLIASIERRDYETDFVFIKTTDNEYAVFNIPNKTVLSKYLSYERTYNVVVCRGQDGKFYILDKEGQPINDDIGFDAVDVQTNYSATVMKNGKYNFVFRNQLTSPRWFDDIIDNRNYRKYATVVLDGVKYNVDKTNGELTDENGQIVQHNVQNEVYRRKRPILDENRIRLILSEVIKEYL